MAAGLTPSEEFVASLCKRAFLRLWTHPNPVGKKGKELCDCLVVCGSHVVIISVKEIEYRDTGDKVGWERWHKAAIEKSAQQIWGAERWLRTTDRFQRRDGRETTLAPESERIYHRISVSLGGRGDVPLRWGDLSLIDHYAEDLLTDGMFDMNSKQVTRDELALVAMARQPRGHRANLADALLVFLGPNGAKIASRAVVAANGTAFVFLGGESSDRDHRARELALRCLVVRGRCANVTTVVGIATDRPKKGKTGYSSDIAYIYMPTWTEDDAAKVDGIQRDLGYFKNTKWPS